MYSEAVPFEDAERAEGRKRGLPELNYFQALGAWAEDKRVIAGWNMAKRQQHGDAGRDFDCCKLGPYSFGGSTVADFGGSNVRFGKSDLLWWKLVNIGGISSLKPSFWEF